MENHFSKNQTLLLILGGILTMGFTVLIITQRISNRQAMTTSSRADELQAINKKEPPNLPEDPEGGGGSNQNPSCSGTIVPFPERDDNHASKCCWGPQGRECSGSTCHFRWLLSCSDGTKTPINFDKCFNEGEWDDYAKSLCCRDLCYPREKNEGILVKCGIQCELARQRGRRCEIEEYIDPTTGKKMIKCCPQEKAPLPTPFVPTSVLRSGCGGPCDNINRGCNPGLACATNPNGGYGQCLNPSCSVRDQVNCVCRNQEASNQINTINPGVPSDFSTNNTNAQ